MMHHWFAQPRGLYLLALLPAMGLLALWGRWRKGQALARLGNPASLQALVDQPRGRRFWRGLCLALGLLCLALGTAGPQWGRDWDQSAAPGRDLVVGDQRKVDRHQLHDRPQPEHRGPYRAADDHLFSDRGVDDACGAGRERCAACERSGAVGRR